MSDLFYKVIRGIGTPVFRLASRPLVLHRERSELPGGYLLAVNHSSPFDVPCLIVETSRHIDWLSIVELFRHPLSAWFLNSMNAFPLDRSRADSATARKILARLRSGRVVGIFPEGGLRADKDSVLRGGGFKPGIGRLAQLARVPVVPCAIVGVEKFKRIASWLPLRRTRYAFAFGEAIAVDSTHEKAACDLLETRLREAFVNLYAEIRKAGAE